MKFFGYIFLFLFVKASFAQDVNQKEIVTTVEVMPEFPGGIQEMMKFILSNIQLPQKVRSGEVIGKCFVRFVVSEKGIVKDISVIKGVINCQDCDREAIRVVSMMPTWKPGIQNGKAVSTFFNLPINFELRGGSPNLSSSMEKNVSPVYSNSKITLPFFRGGPEKMMEFIDKNKMYSKDTKNKGVFGETIVKFFVDSMGKISQVNIRQSSGYVDLDKEAVRIVSIMPNWIPATENGKRLNKYCDLPISFGKKSDINELKRTRYELSVKSFNDGMKSFQNENLDLAKEQYKKAYELNCYYADALYNLGVTYFKLQQKDSACVCWNELKTNFARKDADELIKKYCSN